MAIKEVITLEGVEQVKSQLKDLGNTGEASLKQFSNIGGTGQANPFDGLVKNAQDAGLKLNEVEKHTNSLREAIHVLHPILQAAGLQMSELGSFARLAGASVAALGVAFSGAVVVGLARLEENAARTKGQLADLFGSSDKGEQAFAALAKQAGQFGTTVEGLAPGLESFQAALNSIDRTAQGFRALKEEDLPGAQLAKDATALTEAYGNFIKLLRAGRLDQDQAEKSAKAFFDTLKEGGVVTSAALKSLPTGTINLLKEAFGQAGLTTKQFFAAVDNGAVSVDALERLLINFGPQAQRAFDAKAIKTFGDEFGKIISTLSEGFASLAGKPFSDFIIGELERIRKGIEATITDLQNLKKFETATGSDVIGKTVTAFTDLFKAPATFTERFGDLGDAVKKLPPMFIDASNSLEKLGAAGANMGQLVSKAADLASASLQRMRDEAKVTGEELQDVVIGSTRFQGRLNTVRVFEPQLAGESDPIKEAAKAANELKKAFIDNPFFKDGVGVPITPVVRMEQFTQQLDVMKAISENTLIPVNFDFASALSKVQTFYQSVVAMLSTPIALQIQWQSNPFLSGQPTDLAGGGQVRGPGSSTSDSILAWLSNTEFVVNARAVSHYGLDLFAALNAMRLPKDFISRFSMGGLVRTVSGNRFAAGGQVRSGNPVVLKIDRQSFNMTAGDDTISHLKRFAVASQLSSTGRKPRWVK